jgi:hypothetical protein
MQQQRLKIWQSDCLPYHGFVFGLTVKKHSVARLHHIGCDHAAFLALTLSDFGYAV